MRVVVFAYNFPHKKTQDFLTRMFVEGTDVVGVLAADWVQVAVPPATLRTKVRHINLMHPSDMCRAFKYPYFVVPHDSESILRSIDELKPDLGVIAGARILRKSVIDLFPKGILNIHPGLIPEARGLDAMLWSIYEGHPLGVTAHLIDARVDCGRIVERRTVSEFSDDSLVDLSIRIAEESVNVLPSAIRELEKKPVSSFPLVPQSIVHRKMGPEIESAMPELLRRRLASVGCPESR